jgi:hypothetical protein
MAGALTLIIGVLIVAEAGRHFFLVAAVIVLVNIGNRAG